MAKSAVESLHDDRYVLIPETCISRVKRPSNPYFCRGSNCSPYTYENKPVVPCRQCALIWLWHLLHVRTVEIFSKNGELYSRLVPQCRCTARERKEVTIQAGIKAAMPWSGATLTPPVLRRFGHLAFPAMTLIFNSISEKMPSQSEINSAANDVRHQNIMRSQRFTTADNVGSSWRRHESGRIRICRSTISMNASSVLPEKHEGNFEYANTGNMPKCL